MFVVAFPSRTFRVPHVGRLVERYENVWLLDAFAEWGAHGGSLVMDGGIPHDERLATLDAHGAGPVEPTAQESR